MWLYPSSRVAAVCVCAFVQLQLYHKKFGIYVDTNHILCGVGLTAASVVRSFRHRPAS
jgi:hypothetical protein